MITKKIISIDMGSCEVAVACVYFDEAGRVKKIVNLILDEDKNTVIPAAIMFTGPDRSNPEHIYIGNKAIQSSLDNEKFNYFKESPEYFDEELGLGKIPRRILMGSFFKKLMYNVKKYNPEEIGADDRILLLVGCPSSQEWIGDKNRKKYEKLIQDATGVEEVRIVTESRAAMFSALGRKDGFHISAGQGAAVFDFGSLTADFTYMKTGVDQIEFSWRLGASRIEKGLRRLMCRKAEREAAEKGGYLKQENWSELENELRKKKEAYFNKQLNKNTCKQLYIFSAEDSSGSSLGDVDIVYSVDEASMKQVLEEEVIELAVEEGRKELAVEEGSFKDLCKRFFEYAKRSLEKKKLPLQHIVLTGGASKMGFIRELAAEVFKGQNIICAENPSFSVSHGLIWVAVADESQAECVDVAVSQVLHTEGCRLQDLKTMISEDVGNYVAEGIVKKVREWKDSSTDESVQNLTDRIQRWIQDINVQNKLRDGQLERMNTWSAKTQEAVKMEVRAQAKRILNSELSEALEIPEAVWKRLQEGGDKEVALDVSKVTSGVDLNSIIRKILQWIIVITCGSVGTIFGGPVGTGIGTVVGMIGAAFIDDDDMEKPRSRGIRKRVYNSFSSEDKKNQIKAQCKELIDKSFDELMTESDYEAGIRNTVETAFELITLRRFKL